jgi:hypothetical protein
MTMDAFFIILIIALAALAIWGFFQTNKEKNQKSGLQDRIRTLPGFSPQQTVIKIGLRNARPMGISIDPVTQQFCLIAGDDLHVYPFSALLEAEVVVDDKTITKTSRESQIAGVAVGAALAGGIGAVIGGLSAKTTSQQQIKNVFLRLILNDLTYPIHELEFVEFTNNGSTPGQLALKEAEQWNNMLKVVLAQGRPA